MHSFSRNHLSMYFIVVSHVLLLKIHTVFDEKNCLIKMQICKYHKVDMKHENDKGDEYNMKEVE